MVSADKILTEAQKHQVDLIGLSGLITPSLDEMVHIAREMKRLKMQTPLLIGGATTSRMHTAVKIAPEYNNAVVHVLDASRSVTVAGSLLNPEQKPAFVESIQAEYEKLELEFGQKHHAKKLLPLAEARKKTFPINWKDYHAIEPKHKSLQVYESYDLAEIASYIDWQPF
jgi:5-methyltetrahydrofolate--homocysteine methyltransferase